MAGCAFEAYLEPKGAEEFKDRAVNGTTTTFIDE
jgi:hypothetical protein